VPDRLARLLYLATLAVVPWGALIPFPWLHENARWGDVLFAFAALAWGAGLLAARRIPRFRPVHAGLALYLGWAAVSLLAASPRPASGPAKLLGVAMLGALFAVTSDMMGRPGMPQAIGRTLCVTSLLTALAALVGVALSAFGRITPLVGTCGDLLPGPLSRAQAGFSHPNLLASWSVFASGALARGDAGLSRVWRRVAQAALAVTVVLTTSRAILAFVLALAVRHATTPTRRRLAGALAGVLVLVMLGLTATNATFYPLRPWDVRVLPGASARLEAATASLATFAGHPIFGTGPGTSPGRRGGQPFDAHFTPLNVAATLGLPALAGLAFAAWALWRARAPDRPRHLGDAGRPRPRRPRAGRRGLPARLGGGRARRRRPRLPGEACLMGRAPRALALLGAAVAAACGGRACGGRGGLPPDALPVVKRGDGREYRVLDKGAWKGYYDARGRIAVVEYDSNADGRADYIAHYDERRQIRLIEVDEDHDAWVDRFEHYDAAGVLEKVGRWRRQRGRADEWTYRAPNGRPARIEYDDDGDGKAERADVLRDGIVVRVETDSDRDGRPDRWQAWDRGRLVSEELDTDGDGRPDRRLVFGARSRLLRVERLPR
jgi:hypothetical protein